MKKSALVIFSKDLPKKNEKWWWQFDTVVAPKQIEKLIHKNLTFVNIDDLIEAGSIYEASAFLEELSLLTLPNGSRLSKSFMYKGYELWWINYGNLFLYFCLPYTQYRKLLEYLKSFQNVSFYRPPYKALFSCYLRSYGCKFSTIREPKLRALSFIPFGILLQTLITLLCIPILMVRKRRIMLFTGDKFDKAKDYDFRMKFIYKELRKRNLPFVEFIRSLESWKTVIRHAVKRKRPIIYSEGVAFVGRFASVISGGHRRARRRFGVHTFSSQTDPEARFKLLIATQYLLGVYDDIWAIRIMKLILRVIGVRVAFIPAATERNFHAVLGCKLLDTPIVGIQHGASSKNYFVSDFMYKFDGEKQLSVDKYGVWSQWWKEYLMKNSKVYRPEQLFVSGPMRPIETTGQNMVEKKRIHTGPIRILFISEELVVPNEVIFYLEALLKLPRKDFTFAFRFRPYRDGFRNWLIKNRPNLLECNDATISRGGLQDAIKNSDVVVGSYSTAVLEALFQYKVPILFKTQKWGDVFDIKNYGKNHPFFAEDKDELIEKIKNARSISIETLNNLRERYFGDPHKNGSKWAVDQMESMLLKEDSKK